ncbi:unnamed protein product [Toxocara canis]|uniref:CFEM domain-containing protein n=1 Tax=Toxocara canis TaxID=6265 RepID=A0A183TYI6_TOXCA|nr:unnamed protein product [Toxocara canis]
MRHLFYAQIVEIRCTQFLSTSSERLHVWGTFCVEKTCQVEYLSLQLRWLFIAQVYIVGADSTVSFDNWQCGTDQETREMAYKGAQEGCPNVMGNAQLGQSKCDDDFCECLNSAALKAKNVTNCKSNVELACWAVRFFGSSWYDANAYEQKKQKELNSTKQQKDMKTLAQEPTSSRTHITTKIKAITSEAANTTRVKVTETTAAMTELTPFNAPTPYKSTKPPECVCIMEDVSLQQWCTNAMDICPEYQNEMCDCHLYHTKCDQDIDSNSMLCSIEFAKCLSRSVRMREGKCYETIDAMYIEYVSKANRHPGLLGTMQNWIGGVIGIAVNASTMVANSFEGESWKKVLLMGAIIVLLSMLTYVKFFSNALNALVQWRTPLKLVPEKMRLIQIV